MFSLIQNKWLNFGITTKIQLLFSTLVLACLVVVLVGFFNNRRSVNKLKDTTEVLLPAALLSQQAVTGFVEQLRLYEDAILIGDTSMLQQGVEKSNHVAHLLEQLSIVVDENKYQNKIHIAKIQQDLDSYTRQADRIFVLMNKWSSGENDENDENIEDTLQKNGAQLRKLATGLQDQLATVNVNCRLFLEKQLSDIGALARQGQVWGSLLAFWAICLLPLISFSLARIITRPVIALAQTVRRVTEEGWSNLPTARGNDEVADLTRAFTNMASSLQQWEGELRQHHDNLEKQVQERTSALKEKNELLHREIEERREAQEAAARAREMADSANQAKSTFLANMSHEIRTPMNAILGFTQLMERDDSLNTAQLRNIEIISRSGEHLLALINDILEISKIEAGRININPSNFDLYGLLDDLRVMFLIRTQEKKLRFNIDSEEDLPQYILSDEGKLRQILTNLLGNAVKFTDHGSIAMRVRISGTMDKMLEVEVEDTGCGIPVNEQKNIFEKFHQSTSGINVKGGTGLGLAISREYVQLLGGTIVLRSELDKGSCFSFTLPVEEASAEFSAIHRGKKRWVTGLAPNQDPCKALIVDDRDTNRAFLVNLLQLIGFKVEEAINGMEAVELTASWNPDIILMDINMPIMNGYAATTLIKKQQKTLPIIAVTASVFEDDFNRIMDAGCDSYIRKPFKEQEILDVIREFTGVEYVYKEEKVSKERKTIPALSSSSPTKNSLADNLAILPGRLRSRMALAAITLESDVLLDCIAELDDELPGLAATLNGMVERYAFQEIGELLQMEKE